MREITPPPLRPSRIPSGLSRAPDLRGPRGGIRSRIQSTSSPGQESPRSRSNFSSPLRNIRHETSSGEISRGESDDSGIKLDRDTYQQMFQDVIHIKTNLLKLKRVLQESETLNPFDEKLKVVFLQNQVEERDRKIMELEEALKRANESRPILPQQETSKVNAATQTDKICYVRPLTTHPSLLQTMNDNSNSPFISSTTKGLSSKGK